MPPLVSVLIPACRAEATLCAAVDSVLAGGLPADALEILVESDDGTAYAAASALPSVQVQVTGAIRSGVGPARNRALARATAPFVTYLDADDQLAPGWLAALLPLARAEGAAASALEVREHGVPLLRLWHDHDRLTPALMTESGASARGLFARDRCPPFADALSQDILHMLQVMAAQGGSLPLSPAPYLLNLRPESVTAADDFSARVHRAYLAHVEALRDAPDAAQVFRAKIALNAAYTAEGQGRSYYRWLAARLGQNPA